MAEVPLVSMFDEIDGPFSALPIKLEPPDEDEDYVESRLFIAESEEPSPSLVKKNKYSAEAEQQVACEKFEKIGGVARADLQDFKQRRVQTFKKNLTDLSALELKHAEFPVSSESHLIVPKICLTTLPPLVPPPNIPKTLGFPVRDFIMELLVSGRVDLISWTDYEKAEFKLVSPDDVASLWGEKKGNTKMCYDTFSRTLRKHCHDKMMEKLVGKRYSYRFLPGYAKPPIKRFRSLLSYKRKVSHVGEELLHMPPVVQQQALMTPACLIMGNKRDGMFTEHLLFFCMEWSGGEGDHTWMDWLNRAYG